MSASLADRAPLAGPPRERASPRPHASQLSQPCASAYAEARHFYRSKMLARPLRDICGGKRMPGPRHHRHENFTLAQFRWYGDRRRLQHGGMRADHAVELGARNVLAAAADDVLLARHEKEIAVGVAPHQIAG